VKAKKLYKELARVFDIKTPNDDWYMKNKKYLTPAFKNGKGKEMGVMIDNAKVIGKVYTATFLGEDVIERLERDNAKDALVFVHHAKDWDMGNLKTGGELFTEICEKSYNFLKDNRISVYVAHHPLDNNRSEININKSLANALGLEIVDNNLVELFGISLGVVCRTKAKTVAELQKQVESSIGHKCFLVGDGKASVKGGLVAACGGGGNNLDVYKVLVDKGVNTYITGVVNIETGYPPAVEALEFAKANKINVIAATHYTTEKFALVDMVDWFRQFGLDATFIEQEPKFTDYTYKGGL